MKNPESQGAESQSDKKEVTNENLTYEYFIRKCFACKRFQHGANTDTWENLKTCEYDAKQAPLLQKYQEKFEKKLKNVQNYLVEAFDASFKRLNEHNASDNDIEQMRVLKERVAEAVNTTDLMTVIQEADKILINNNIIIK